MGHPLRIATNSGVSALCSLRVIALFAPIPALVLHAQNPMSNWVGRPARRGAVCPCVSRPTGQSIRRVPSAEYATLLRSPIVSSTSPLGNVLIQTFFNWKKFSKTLNKSISFELFVGMKQSISNNTYTNSKQKPK